MTLTHPAGRKHRKRIVFFQVLAGLLIALACNQVFSQTQSVIILEGWEVTSPITAEVMLPFTLEAQADVIALGTIGEAFKYEGKQLVKLTINETLKGELAIAELFPEDTAPFFGCVLPKEDLRPSEQVSPGTPVVVYLTMSDGIPRILHIQQYQAPYSEDSKRQLQKFVSLLDKINSSSPPWDNLLPNNGLGLDLEMYYALMHSDLQTNQEKAQEAGKALLNMLNNVLQQLQEGKTLDLNDWERISHLIYQAQRLGAPKETLNAHIELLTYAISNQSSGEIYTRAFIPHGSLLADATPEQATTLINIFEKLLEKARGNSLNYQDVVTAIARVPGDDAGRVLLAEMDREIPEALWAARLFLSENPSSGHRDAMMAKAQELLERARSEPNSNPTLESHLKLLLES